jgi:hypothetical protein
MQKPHKEPQPRKTLTGQQKLTMETTQLLLNYCQKKVYFSLGNKGLAFLLPPHNIYVQYKTDKTQINITLNTNENQN